MARQTCTREHVVSATFIPQEFRSERSYRAGGRWVESYLEGDRVVRLIETESRTVIARSWGRGEWEVII